jgi:hypothetical protein
MPNSSFVWQAIADASPGAIDPVGPPSNNAEYRSLPEGGVSAW